MVNGATMCPLKRADSCVSPGNDCKKSTLDGQKTLTASKLSFAIQIEIGRQLSRHILLVSAASLVLAALDVWFSGTAERTFWSWPVGAAAGATLAPIVALVQLSVQHLGARFWRWQPTLLRESASSTIRVHAAAVLSLLCLVGVLSGVWVVSTRLQTVQDATMQNVLLVVAVGTLILANAALVVVAFPIVERLLVRVHQRIGLPWPHSRLSRYVCYVLGPTFLLVMPLLKLYGDDLGPILPPVAVLLLLETEGLIVLVIATIGARPRKFLSRVAILVWLAIVLGAPVAMGTSQGVRLAGTRGLFTPRALSVLRSLSDVDRDGYSSLYAGGDCATLDSSANPAAIDIPANGKDENCDGQDAVAGKQEFVRGNLFSGTLTSEQIQKYNVIWVIADAIRADSMGLYGYQRANTPMLAKFAESALVFEKAIAPSATTHLSVPAMMIGKNVERITWEYRKDDTRLEPSEQHHTLAQRLKQQGYRTVQIISPHMARLHSMTQGFDDTINLSKFRGRSTTDGPVSTGLAIDESHGKEPFFLMVYYEDPHKPYEKHGKAFSFGSNEKARYDGEIAFVDHHFGQLVEHLQKLHPKTWKDTIVIFTSDHGEEFNEHGSTGHGKTCYGESAHVPLIMRIPGFDADRISSPVSLVDIVPTLLELVGAPGGSDELDGRSLLHVAQGEDAAAVPTFCAILNQGTVGRNRPFYQRSVRFNGRHLIHRLLTDEHELYDMNDSLDTQNLLQVAGEVQVLEQLKGMLQANADGNLAEKQLYR